jgi:hypothetical protein
MACSGLMGSIAAGCGSEGKGPGAEPTSVVEEAITGSITPISGGTGSIVCNGSFEDPQLPFTHWDEVTSIPCWKAVAVPAPETQFCIPAIEQDNHAGNVPAAPAGNQSVELNANCPSGIEQDVATVPGTTYVLTFAFAGRGALSAAYNRLNVYWDGNPVTATLTSASPKWVYSTFAVTATGSTTKLAFTSGTTFNTSVGTELDDVSLIPMAPGGGAFVIGDQSSALGASVTFWGAQWSKDNAVSGGSAPASFKGFAEGPVSLCGSTWSADPGGSTPPPAGPLPDTMAVLVSSSVSKSGPNISGNTAGVVLIQTNPGYGPDPGTAGTGTVTAVLCP